MEHLPDLLHSLFRHSWHGTLRSSHTRNVHPIALDLSNDSSSGSLGSSLAAISIQFLIQCRVVSLMKSRVVFMVMNWLHSNDLTTILHRYPNGFQWDEFLPAEECLASLGQFLGLHGYLMNQTERAFGKMNEHMGKLQCSARDALPQSHPSSFVPSFFLDTSSHQHSFYCRWICRVFYAGFQK